MKKSKISISDFYFIPISFGCYKVTYISPITGKKWTKRIDNMSLIDATKSEINPKICDLEKLKKIVKG